MPSPVGSSRSSCLPRSTYLPLLTALMTGVFFLLMLFKLYALAPFALFGVAGMFLVWTRATGARQDLDILDAGCGEQAPVHFQSRGAPSEWAMALTLVANGTLYASLLFGGLFLWVSAPKLAGCADYLSKMTSSFRSSRSFVLAGALFASSQSVRTGAQGAHWLAGSARCLASRGRSTVWLDGLWHCPAQHPARAFCGHLRKSISMPGFMPCLGMVFALYGIWRVLGGLRLPDARP